MSPGRVLAFVAAVLVLLALIGQALPKDGVDLGLVNLRMPTASEVLFAEKQQLVDISEILAIEADSAASDTLAIGSLADTLPAATADSARRPIAFDESKLAPLEDRIRFHFPDQGASVLHPFFKSLQSAYAGKEPIRVLHYGDSQIEGDRITAYVRNKLQTQFHGSGPGLIAVLDVGPHFSVKRELSANWQRFSAMDPNLKKHAHKRYGALSAYCRFTPAQPDSVALDTLASTATITLSPDKRAYGKARAWTECRLFFGWHRAPLTLRMEADGAQMSEEVIEPQAGMLTREWRFPRAPGSITITMGGTDSPDVFGIALDGSTGVAMDNISARGAAGYEFGKGDQALLTRMYAAMDARLLIMQYGGNTLPNIKSKEEADRYGRFFGGVIAKLRKQIPGVSVIVIGPSDMSIKEGEDYVTRPYLEDVRDAMKANTLAQGAVFWDMYDAMGGRNSMVSWVQADPPLAADDYTHFSPQGARKVGELFYTALINEYAVYVKTVQ
jgi:lysophospholipase L1-like esterase